VIHVLVLLECVLLMIIGFDKFIDVSTPDGPTEIAAPGVEASSEIQISSMRSAILPTAAAAGPESLVSISPAGEAHSILPLSPSESDSPLPKLPYPELLEPISGSGSMREADRIAIARELLGSIVDDRETPSAPLETTGNNQVAEPATDPLPHPAKASRPKAPLPPTASSLRQPVARPEVPTKLASMSTVVPLVKPGSEMRRQRTDPGATSTAKITEAQRLLTLLGYQTGIDGVFGKRTELAIRSFQQGRGGNVDGRISDALIGRLRVAVRNQDVDSSPTRLRRYDIARKSEDAGWVSSFVAGYQRLVGHRFDSIARPRELRSYCELQSDTWVFDEGSGRLVYCGRIAAASN
jgi:Putative peptidoglycan binding domain